MCNISSGIISFNQVPVQKIKTGSKVRQIILISSILFSIDLQFTNMQWTLFSHCWPSQFSLHFTSSPPLKSLLFFILRYFLSVPELTRSRHFFKSLSQFSFHFVWDQENWYILSLKFFNLWADWKIRFLQAGYEDVLALYYVYLSGRNLQC